VSALRDRVAAVASVAFGLMWLVAAAAKLASPLVPYEMVAHAVDPGTPTKALLAGAVACEVALGVAMVLRAIQGFALSLAGLVAASLVLLAVRSSAAELVPCGCFGDMLGTTLDQSLVRNAILAAILVALILWNRKRVPA
jgi:HAMP domain-containing protein